jgi:4-amino-4-deoxy-L-arabinose transferase-like glycosyltransferase
MMTFSERTLLRYLFLTALIVHTVVFLLLVGHYGIAGLYASTDGTLNGNDTQHYVVIAKNIVEGNGYSRFVDAPFEPDALRPPLLPLYFIPFIYFGGVHAVGYAIIVLNSVLALWPVIVYMLARQYMTVRSAAFVGWLCVVEPLFIYRSHIAEPDALFVVLFSAALLLTVKFWRIQTPRYIIGAAFLLGLAILAKPVGIYASLAIGVATVGYGWWSAWSWRTGWRSVVMAGLLCICMVAPWMIRNHSVFGIWGFSSITGYNFYQYYTASPALSTVAEKIPAHMYEQSREPSRFLPFQDDILHMAFARIKAHPTQYIHEHLTGTVRNMLVSDLSPFYYNHHDKLLPFEYNPEGGSRALKVLWFMFMGLWYVLAVAGWLLAWRRKDTYAVAGISLFLVLAFYFMFSAGTFVDPKYRLPIIPLIAIAAAYFWCYRKQRKNIFP